MADRESYPSPSPASNGLPFYQHTEQQAQEHGQQQRGPAEPRAGVPTPTQTDHSAHPHAQAQAQTHAHHEVPDDPQLRANIIDRIGSFGNFGAPPPNMTRQSPPATPSSAIPQGSVAYAQFNGSADAAPPAADKNKDKRTKVSRACDECRRKKIRCENSEK